jgi:hypothetical protein
MFHCSTHYKSQKRVFHTLALLMPFCALDGGPEAEHICTMMEPMSLSDYLDLSGETDAEFAKRVGVARSTVTRWRLGIRIPRMQGRNSEMARVRKATEGLVSADSFLARGGPRRGPHTSLVA